MSATYGTGVSSLVYSFIYGVELTFTEQSSHGKCCNVPPDPPSEIKDLLSQLLSMPLVGSLQMSVPFEECLK